jgi:hypothetical protein
MKPKNKTTIITGAAAGVENLLRSTIQKFGRVAIDAGHSI